MDRDEPHPNITNAQTWRNFNGLIPTPNFQDSQKKSDYLGRWAWIVVQREKNKRLCIMQTYMPHKKFGLFTSATQQYQALNREQPKKEPKIQK